MMLVVALGDSGVDSVADGLQEVVLKAPIGGEPVVVDLLVAEIRPQGALLLSVSSHLRRSIVLSCTDCSTL
ncbi:hypothetical protein [Rhodococcus opacus]|uniref:hypothetical protein n=1 Tax=Rhodococcus opacus TaxID=37919 RepID=UPI0022368639|nr:hypothetical protein [Rhodococcus opacus]UZG59624.1 hypothetical protein ONE62_38255 [Rhodococcus opacus]